MTDMKHINPMEDPQNANALVAAVLADDKPEAPTIAPQPSGFVRLAGGPVSAEVRELNGVDEEYIDRVRTGRPEKFVEAVVERGTVNIDGSPLTKAALGEILLGDAELLFTEIRRATYGDEIEFEGFTCPHCREALDVTIEIDDIPVTRLEKVEDQFFDIPLRKGSVAHCRLPRFSDGTDLADAELSDAERRTLLLSRVVLSVTTASGSTEPIAGSVDAARALSLSDRSKIIEEIGNRKIGPKYNEVSFTHETCGKEVPFPLVMGDLFRDL